MSQALYEWNRCPSCQSTNIEGGSIEVEDLEAWQDVKCLDCEVQWLEVYHANRRVGINGYPLDTRSIGMV